MTIVIDAGSILSALGWLALGGVGIGALFMVPIAIVKAINTLACAMHWLGTGEWPT